MINKKYFLINPPTVGCLHFLMGQRSSQKVSVIKLKNVGLFIVHERSHKIIPMPLFSSSTPRVTTLQVEIPGISLSFALDLQPEAKMN